MMDESQLRERMESAEAKLRTCTDQIERVKEKYRAVMATLGARERFDGAIDINFKELAERLPLSQALELRAAIDVRHRISGELGAKPRIVIKAIG